MHVLVEMNLLYHTTGGNCMLEKIKAWIIEQVLWAETNMKGKTGQEKRNAVVQKLDDMIVFPAVLEPFDGPIIGFFVDLAVSKLNTTFGHCFGEAEIPEGPMQRLAESIEIPGKMASALKDAVIKGVS